MEKHELSRLSQEAASDNQRRIMSKKSGERHLRYLDIGAILEQNKDKNFVKRIMNPNRKSINLGKGQYGTHLMSYAKAGDQYIAYPSIIEQDGELQELSDAEAYKHAIQTREFISFDNSKEAEIFSKQYKDIWEEPSRAPFSINKPKGVTAPRLNRQREQNIRNQELRR